MEEFLKQDLGSSLLALVIILGWIGISFVFLRILTLLIKRILESLTKKSKESSSEYDLPENLVCLLTNSFTATIILKFKMLYCWRMSKKTNNLI